MSRAGSRFAVGVSVVVALATGAAAVVWSRGRALGDRTDVPTFTVTRTSFHLRVTAEGNLKAVKATPLTAPQRRTPVVIAWVAAEGIRVAEGDVLARFDPTQMEKSLADATADRAAAELKIAKERVQSQAGLRDRERAAAVTRQELDKLRALPAQDPRYFSQVDILEGQIDEALYNHRLDHAAGARQTEEELARSKLDLLAIERRKAELFMQQARDGLSELQLVAPHAGIFVLERDWRGKTPHVGDTLWPGNPIGEVALPDAMEAEVHVLEADAGGLAAGKRAELSVDASPDVIYGGRIRMVEALAKPRIPEVPISYFGVTIALDRSDPAAMKPGQRVRATLLLEEVPDALVVPRQAVFDRDGRLVVLRRRGRLFDAAPVKLGSATVGRVVITHGLAPGDVIALRDPSRTLGDRAADQDDGKTGGGGTGPTAPLERRR